MVSGEYMAFQCKLYAALRKCTVHCLVHSAASSGVKIQLHSEGKRRLKYSQRTLSEKRAVREGEETWSLERGRDNETRRVWGRRMKEGV